MTWGGVCTRLGVEDSGQYLVRPDGHVAFRCAGTNLDGVTAYLHRWFIAHSSSCDAVACESVFFVHVRR